MSTTNDYTDLLTTAAAARALGVSTERVRQLVRESRLASERTPYGRLFRTEEVERFRAERAARAT